MLPKHTFKYKHVLANKSYGITHNAENVWEIVLFEANSNNALGVDGSMYVLYYCFGIQYLSYLVIWTRVVFG